jgi:hypothetical protein
VVWIGGWEGAYGVGQDDYEVVEGLFGLSWWVSVEGWLGGNGYVFIVPRDSVSM